MLLLLLLLLIMKKIVPFFSLTSEFLASQVQGGDIRIEEALFDRAVVAIEPVLHSTKWGQRGAQRGRIR